MGVKDYCFQPQKGADDFFRIKSYRGQKRWKTLLYFMFLGICPLLICPLVNYDKDWNDQKMKSKLFQFFVNCICYFIFYSEFFNQFYWSRKFIDTCASIARDFVLRPQRKEMGFYVSRANFNIFISFFSTPSSLSPRGLESIL